MTDRLDFVHPHFDRPITPILSAKAELEASPTRQAIAITLALASWGCFDLNGESVGVRTRDLLIKSQLLYRLSYALPRPRMSASLKVRGT